eukprot:TRINITY_DN7154_c1_g1_i1.p1 TRINITY_DN7154_c1_g1~~TRINITY_DN7154_c1_g1_i1.p1  ORF type:complete len:566 (-),score=92.70 TRINITY_DN7154_c1_g1_i1:180-1877(-)
MLRLAPVLLCSASGAGALSSEGWQSRTPLADERIHLTFAVKQQNTGELLKRFEAISDPTHPSYGSHMSLEEVDALLAPKAEDVAVVQTLLAGMDVKSTGNSDFMTVETTVGNAEHLLSARFRQHCHPQHGCRFRAHESSLPQQLQAVVDFVSPWDEPLPREKASSAIGVEAQSQPKVTPQWLRDRYKVGDVHGAAAANKQAVAAFDGEKYGDSKLQSFFNKFWSSAKGNVISKTVGDGPTTGRSPTNEGDLDVQYLMSMGDDVRTEWWSFSGTAPGASSVEPFLKFLYTLGNTSDAPLVFSFSYGDVETEVPGTYADRCNVEFQKAGVRGISLIFGSGDGGIAGNRPVSYCGNSGCVLADKSKPDGLCFVPTWPASSPYVTSVGGTATSTSGAQIAEMQSCGGFSYRFKRPSYQEVAVESYLAKNGSLPLPENARFNRGGRGFPDVAGMFENYQIYTGGLFPVSSIGGTSASAPVFAGIVSLLNDLRLQKGSSPLGFLNPLLYQNADSLQDITQGSNGVPSKAGCNSEGFPATEGWDGVTGLGEPDYQKLAKVVLATAPVAGIVV